MNQSQDARITSIKIQLHYVSTIYEKLKLMIIICKLQCYRSIATCAAIASYIAIPCEFLAFMLTWCPVGTIIYEAPGSLKVNTLVLWLTFCTAFNEQFVHCISVHRHKYVHEQHNWKYCKWWKFGVTKVWKIGKFTKPKLSSFTI